MLRFFKDAKRPQKLAVLAALLYAALPADLIPDVIPVVGLMDDVGLFLMTFAWMRAQRPGLLKRKGIVTPPA